LRGLVDYFIDKANKQGEFNGRVVVVKSTDTGDTNAFSDQENLYTICIRGIENDKKIEENIVCAAISRVLSAKTDWQTILKCAHNSDLKIVVSNTTEAGLQLTKEKVFQQVPSSFPGKLLTFLFERYKVFGETKESGLIIIPTELITDNGKKLASIVNELARYNNLDEAFINWLNNANTFCNSLVDRIVPGKPEAATLEELQRQLGYKDELLLIAEKYCLWAIEGDEEVKAVLSFSKANKEVIIEPDIEIYKELKLRLLNGTHTLSCGVAFLAGITTVKEGMNDEAVSKFVSDVMLKEIGVAIPYSIPPDVSNKFAQQVLDRFRNPHIHHNWINITLQYSLKLKMRVVPVLLRYYELYKDVPRNISIGFAAYILFMKSVKKDGNNYWGAIDGRDYVINDDKAWYFYECWQKFTEEEIAKEILSNEQLWDVDLSALPNFANSVKNNLQLLTTFGVKRTLNNYSKRV
jgi:tagaturonate reductase